MVANPHGVVAQRFGGLHARKELVGCAPAGKDAERDAQAELPKAARARSSHGCCRWSRRAEVNGCQKSVISSPQSHGYGQRSGTAPRGSKWNRWRWNGFPASEISSR